jgi:hypothetical protein
MRFKKVKEGKFRVGAVFGVAALGSVLIANQQVFAQSCIEEQAQRSLVCTANDVRIAYADNIRDVLGTPLSQCVRGSTFSFIADFHVQTTATSRYDIGLYFATDGDPNGNGARSGVCSANVIRDRYLDPAAPNAVMLGSDVAANLDGDFCRDINTANGWGLTGGQVVTVRVDDVYCQDSDHDGKLNLPNCTSWSQNTGVVCNSAQDAAPGSPSKCSCDIGFNVPIFVETGSIQVTKDASPASRPEPGGDFAFAVGVHNNAAFTSLTLDRICDDKYGLIAKVASAPDCPAGTLGPIQPGTTCAVPQTLAPGGNYSCSFTGSVTSDVATTVTNVVTVFGHDQNNVALQGSDSAQVAITNVPPTASVVKSLVGLACADVNYRVRVENTDPSEALTLTALSDSGFGSITSVHGDVLGTNCGVAAPNGPGTLPATIPVGGSYECDFRAHFCGGSHTDTVTATVNDNDGSTITPTSNSLTVNVSAN